jgi:hypothetical protein
MSAPTRFSLGFTNAASFQPLGQIGVPDPFFYAYYDDDFLPYNAAIYTVTASGGSVAGVAGSGGRILLTTAATAASSPTLQFPFASFQYTASKKLAYLCRLQGAAVLTQSWVLGLINTTSTPQVGGQITDGVYISKAAGSLNLVLNVVTGSAVVGTATFTGANLLNATDIDIGFYVDRLGNIKAFAGANLEGAKRQNFANLGTNFGIPATSLTGAITSVLLNPTLSVGNGATAAITTITADFLYAAQER